ncbi:STAS/SEC14 domain-containing protein [Natronomonas sp. F2-12]|uniref:STAS/SEC14 domain-containing protein n=1 Tax=Natronomonas aquatica TaxID=2841590 RepID=A0A9R1D747_9EURY|nr:STAS/SEC14 domain-containing protein [Natronomonas aquatica]MCQ4334228.1 STAS/SEC14 domain-containing protein [Natronomonas aquatica]
MFDVLDETEGDLVAIRVGRGTRQGYDELYSLLAEKTDKYGAVRVLEVVPDWTLSTFLSHVYGIIPDLRFGSQFTISRYVAVGDSIWAKLLFDWWNMIRPVWPAAPGEMRYFEIDNRDAALQWINAGDES